MPTCCWMSTATAMAPIRFCARGPSGMFTASTPASRMARTDSSIFVGFGTLRRSDLDRRDELAARDLARPSGALGQRGRLERLVAVAIRIVIDDDELPARRERPDGVGHHADVLGRGPAAAAQELDSLLNEPLAVFGHVLGRRHVHLPAADLARQAGVRLRGDLLAP